MDILLMLKDLKNTFEGTFVPSYLKKTLKILEKDLGKYYFHFRCHI